MNWRREFSRTIQERGKIIYQRNAVNHLSHKDNQYAAIVSGSEPYVVQIKTKEENILSMNCDCPFARGGNHCKHMAAVCYAIEAEENQNKYQQESLITTSREEQIKAYAQKHMEEKRQQQEEQRKKLEEEKRIAQEKKLLAQKKKQEEEAKLQQQFDEEERKEKARIRKEESDRYSYYDRVKLRESIKSDYKVWMKARELAVKEKVSLQTVNSGFSEHGEEQIAVAVGRAEEKNTQSLYLVRIYFTKNKITDYDCGCPTCVRNSYSYWNRPNNRLCEHVIGLFLLTDQYLSKHPIGDNTDRSGFELLNVFQKQRSEMIVSESSTKLNDRKINLVPRLKKTYEGMFVSFKIGFDKLYVVKDLQTFVEQVQEKESVTYGKNMVVNHLVDCFSDRSQQYYNFIEQIIDDESQIIGDYYGYGKKNPDLKLYGHRLDDFYQLLGEDTVEYESFDDMDKKKYMLSARKQNPKVELSIIPVKEEKEKKEFQGIQVHCLIPDVFEGSNNSYYIDFEQQKLCQMEKTFSEKMQPITTMCNRGYGSFRIGRNNLSAFYYTVLPQIQDYVTINELQPEEIRQYLPQEVAFKFYLDAEDGNIICRAEAMYAEGEFSIIDAIPQAGKSQLLDNFREQNREEEVCYLVKNWFPEIDFGEKFFHCNRDEEHVYQFMKHGVNALLKIGEVQSTDRFQRLTLRSQTKISIGVSTSNGILDLNVMSEDVSQKELLDILQSYRLKKKYHRLKNGDFVDIDETSFEMLNDLMESMHLTVKEFVKGKMQIPAYRALYLDRMLQDNEDVYINRDHNFRSLLKDFKTINEAEYEEPESLKRVLRNYQRTGFKWLRTIEAYHFGGILADDMGLGKTLQLITLLLHAKQEGRLQTALIVCPASLVYNWQEEIQHFDKENILKVAMVTGSQGERKKIVDSCPKYDVLVTSYDLLKRDIDYYEDNTFTYEVLDEAQYIKNHTTAVAKAVKIIHSETRFALTGTPIENRLSELWSIFDYLMPGFLFTYEVFKREFETPIAKNEDKQVMERLQKMVRPFILRRLKEDVLKDIPAKLTETQYAVFPKEQQLLYDAQLTRMKQKIAAQDQSEFQKNKMQILAELTKLRQICCDPTLLFDNYKGESAKFQLCIDLLERAIEGNHKILLFSQFTSMLDLLSKELDKRNIAFYTITGSTPKEKRIQFVNQFNKDTTPVFLISLKAGGTGLNLTGADIVIHYDPWWNIAAQNQATDRAHRIGQEKVVTVYQLIAKNSVEEKIQKLQESKKNLADQIMNGESNNLSSLNKEELLEILG